MAGPFDFLFGGDNSGPARGTTPAPTRGPEPFNMLDVFGIGSDARNQQRRFDEEQRRHMRGRGEADAVTKAENALQARALELRETMPDAQPHQIFSTLVRDPVFAQNAVSIPVDRQQAIVQSIIKATSPPDPTVHKLNPGDANVYTDNQGREIRRVTNPDRKVQEWQYLNNLPPEDLDKVSRAIERVHKAPTESDKEQAWTYLVRNGLAKETDRNKVMAGTLKLQKRAVRNPTGELVEEKFYMVDSTDPNNVTETEVQPGPRATAPGQPGAPVQPQPRPGQPPNAEIPTRNKHVEDGSMLDVVGGLNQAYDTATRWAGQIPAFRGLNEEGNAKSDALQAYNDAVITAMDRGGRLKRTLEATAGSQLTDKENPLSAANKLLTRRNALLRQRQQEAAIYGSDGPKAARAEAFQEIQNIDQLLEYMPSSETLQKRIQFYRQNREWGITPPGADEIKERAGEVTLPGQPKPPGQGQPQPQAKQPKQAIQRPAVPDDETGDAQLVEWANKNKDAILADESLKSWLASERARRMKRGKPAR